MWRGGGQYSELHYCDIILKQGLAVVANLYCFNPLLQCVCSPECMMTSLSAVCWFLCSGNTPLHAAVTNRNLETVRYLLKYNVCSVICVHFYNHSFSVFDCFDSRPRPSLSACRCWYCQQPRINTASHSSCARKRVSRE